MEEVEEVEDYSEPVVEDTAEIVEPVAEADEDDVGTDDEPDAGSGNGGNGCGCTIL